MGAAWSLGLTGPFCLWWLFVLRLGWFGNSAGGSRPYGAVRTQEHPMVKAVRIADPTLLLRSFVASAAHARQRHADAADAEEGEGGGFGNRTDRKKLNGDAGLLDRASVGDGD